MFLTSYENASKYVALSLNLFLFIYDKNIISSVLELQTKQHRHVYIILKISKSYILRRLL
jgi:hypothetical protein